MPVSILDALEGAEYNLCQGRSELNVIIGRSQLHNAVELLGKGYSLSDDIDELLSGHRSVDEIPDKDPND